MKAANLRFEKLVANRRGEASSTSRRGSIMFGPNDSVRSAVVHKQLRSGSVFTDIPGTTSSKFAHAREDLQSSMLDSALGALINNQEARKFREYDEQRRRKHSNATAFDMQNPFGGDTMTNRKAQTPFDLNTISRWEQLGRRKTKGFAEAVGQNESKEG